MSRPPPTPESPGFISGPFPPHVVFKILQKLPTGTLFTASLVCSSWRKLIYSSGPRSQALLKPHLSVLRERFGSAEVPQRLPITTVRVLVARFAKEELFGSYCTPVPYAVPRLRKFALCGSLLAVVTQSRRVHVYSLRSRVWSTLVSLKLPAKPLAIAVSDGYLVAADEKNIHLYHLLAKSSVTAHVYTVAVPGGGLPVALTLTEGAQDGPPLVALLSAEQIYLIHPSYALNQKRGAFFLTTSPGSGNASPNAAPTPATARPTLARRFSSASSFAKSGLSRATSKSAGKAPATAPPSVNGLAAAPASTSSLLSSPSPTPTGPITFGMSSRHLLAGASYLGSAWSAESPAEIARRRMYSLKAGQDLVHKPHTPDALWRHYRGITAAKTANPVPRWLPKPLDTAEMHVRDPVHVFDSYYVVTDLDTRWVRIVSVAPFEARFILYREDERLGMLRRRTSSFGGKGEEGSRPRCPRYAVQPGPIVDGRRIGGYIAFSPADGVLKILPLVTIPWDVGRGEIGAGTREVEIESGEILAMAAGTERVVVVFAERVVVVRLWTREMGSQLPVGEAGWGNRETENSRPGTRGGELEKTRSRGGRDGRPGTSGTIMEKGVQFDMEDTTMNMPVGKGKKDARERNCVVM